MIRAHHKVEPIFVHELSDLPALIKEHARDNDVIILQGAGNIGGVAKKLVKEKVQPKEED